MGIDLLITSVDTLRWQVTRAKHEPRADRGIPAWVGEDGRFAHCSGDCSSKLKLVVEKCTLSTWTFEL